MQNQPKKGNLAWKIYFWCYLILALLAFLGTLADKTSKSVDYIDAFISLPSVVALLGWAWQKKLLAKPLWMAYAILFLVYDLFYNIQQNVGEKFEPIIIVVFVLLLPSYLAVVFYAASKNIWRD